MTLKKAMKERRDISSVDSFSKCSPQIKFVLFIEALSQAYEDKEKSTLSVDDAILLNDLAPWRELR